MHGKVHPCQIPGSDTRMYLTCFMLSWRFNSETNSVSGTKVLPGRPTQDSFPLMWSLEHIIVFDGVIYSLLSCQLWGKH